jgi:hypothetical protein
LFGPVTVTSSSITVSTTNLWNQSSFSPTVPSFDQKDGMQRLVLVSGVGRFDGVHSVGL